MPWRHPKARFFGAPPRFFAQEQRNGVERAVGRRDYLPRKRRTRTSPLPKVGRETSRPPTGSAHANGGAAKVKKRFSLAARHRFFGQAPKKWGRMAGQGNDHRPKYRRTRTRQRQGGTSFARLRVRRFPGQKSLPPTARSTPFLCSCAKKRGGAPKKRAYGCRHGSSSVPPASPTNSKPQHHRRLRQADLSARSTTKPLPKLGEDE